MDYQIPSNDAVRGAKIYADKRCSQATSVITA
jgi:hypothetical protein